MGIFIGDPIPGYIYTREVFLQDHFIGGATTSGAIGELGWSSSGTITRPSSTTNHPGQARISTSAVQGTQGRLSFGQNSVVLDPSLPFDMTWIVKPIEVDSDTQIRIGISNAVQTDPPTHGFYLEKLYADSNVFIVTRAGGVQTRVDGSVAWNTLTSDFITVRLIRSSLGAQWYLNGNLLGGVQATNIPTAFLNPKVSTLNQAAAAKTMDIDYFQFRGTGLVL